MAQFRSIVEEYLTQVIKDVDSKQSELFSHYDNMAKKLNDNITLTNERYKLIHTGLILINKKIPDIKANSRAAKIPLINTTPIRKASAIFRQPTIRYSPHSPVVFH